MRGSSGTGVEAPGTDSDVGEISGLSPPAHGAILPSRGVGMPRARTLALRSTALAAFIALIKGAVGPYWCLVSAVSAPCVLDTSLIVYPETYPLDLRLGQRTQVEDHSA